MTNEETLIELDVICMSCQGEHYEDKDCGHRDKCYVTNCKEALEKQILMKPKVINKCEKFCPRCYDNELYFPVNNYDFGIKIGEIRKDEIKRITHCKHCGQAIDWSEE